MSTRILLALLMVLTSPFSVRASGEPIVVVPALITAELSAVVDFTVHIEATTPLPAESSVVISGLPKSVVFSAGQTAGPGVWQVPVTALKGLKMVVTATEAAKSSLLILLSTQDKGLHILASARSMLVVDDSKQLALVRQADEARKLEAARAAEQEKLAEAKRAEEARLAAEAEAAEKQRQALKAQAERALLEKAEAERAAAAKAEEAKEKAERTAKTEVASAQAQAPTSPPKNAPPDANVPSLSELSPDHSLDPAAAARLLKRGEGALAQGNILTARQYFLRSAQAGLADAALKLAETYDPHELTRLNVRGVVPDPAVARLWYFRALQLGAAGAKDRLARLGQ